MAVNPTEDKTLKGKVDAFMGDTSLYEKIFGEKKMDPAEAVVFQQADNILDKITSGKDLQLDELSLLPSDIAKDLSNRYENKITVQESLPLALQGQNNRDRTRNRIRERLLENKRQLDRKTSMNELAEAWLLTKRDQRIFEEKNYSPTKLERVRQIRRTDLDKNRAALEADFKERGITNYQQQIDKLVESGDYNYEDAYLYLANQSNYVQKLDFWDFIKTDHPSRYFSDNIPFYGSWAGMSRMAQLGDKIEILDAAGVEELEKPEYKDMIRDVALFLDSLDSDKSIVYKFAESLTMMADYMVTRGVGRATQAAGFRKLQGIFPRLNKAMTTAVSPNFRSKIKNAASKGKSALVSETALAFNPAGGLLSTYESVAEHQVRGQELMHIEVGEDPNTKEKYLVSLDFKNPKESLDAWQSAVGSSVISGLVERLGGVASFDWWKKSPNQDAILGKIFNGALFKSFKKANPKVDGTRIIDFLDKANINGIVPEILEERVDAITVSALGIDEAGMEIRPGFQLFNERTQEWEQRFGDLVIPSLEDFAVEVATIASFGGMTRYADSRMNPGMPSIKMKPEVVKKGTDDFVRDFVKAGKTQEGKPRELRVNETVLSRTNDILEKGNFKPLRYTRLGKISKRWMNKAKERGRKSIVPELIEWFTNPTNEKLVEHATTWYGDRFDQTINLLAQNQFPELNDSNERAFFTFLVGITSPSQAPEPNLKNAINEYMIHRGFPTDSKTSASVTKQIAMFKKIADHKGGFANAMDFMATKMTGRELRKELFNMGVGNFTFDEKKGIVGALPGALTLDEEMYAAELLGPKVGAFTLNLAGISEIPTIDLWMLRNISMHLGIPFDNKTMAQVMSYHKRETKKGETKTDWLDGLGLVRADARDNGNRKRVKIYREIVKEVQQEFNKQTGENFTVAEVQALIWYMEKSIFTSYGTKGSEVDLSDYLTVTESIVNSGRVYNERTQRSLRTTSELRAEERAEEVLSRDDTSDDEESVQEESGTDDREVSDQESVRGGSSGDSDQGLSKKKSKSQPGLLTKSVPQVSELTSDQAQDFYDNLQNHKDTHEEGYAVELKSVDKYAAPYKEKTDDGRDVKVTPTMIMSEDGKAGAVLLYKEIGPRPKKKGFFTKKFDEGTVEVDIASVFGGMGEVTGQEVIRSAIRKAKRMNPDRITLDAFEGKLPSYYKLFGFVEDFRLKWNDEYAPEEWQLETHKKNYPDTEGKPDVVFMVFDPKKARADKNHPYRKSLGLENDTEYRAGDLYAKVHAYINDQLKPLKDLSLTIEENIGPLRDSEDFYGQSRRAWNIAIGKFNQTLEWADDFIDRMAKDGITIQMLDRYMHAKHARERNALGAVRNKKVDVIAGYNNKGEQMTDENAKAILAEFKDTVIDDYAREFRENVILRNIQVRLQGGLLTDESARIFSGNAPISEGKKPEENISFKNYVPLSIELEDDGSVGGIFKNVGVRGFSLNGPESKRIKGSDTETQRKSIFQMGLENLLMGFTRAESNQINLKLFNALRATDVVIDIDGVKTPLFEVKEMDYTDKQNYDQFGNPKYIYASQLEENQILFKENGIEYIVTINDPDLVGAFQNTSVFGQNSAVQFANSINNFIKGMATTFSPGFVISNAQADLQAGFLRMGIDNGAKMAVQAAAKVPKSFAALRRFYFGNKKNQPMNDYDAALQEMIAYGGQISFFDFDGFVTKYKDFGNKLETMGPKARQQSMVEMIGDFIKRSNQVIEQQMRLATYMTMRDNGYSPERAALAARDITIDFNKSGKLGKVMEALYAFSKVGVNQIYSLGELARNNKAKTTGVGFSLMMLGYISAELNKAHDEEEEEKIGDWHKYRNFYINNFLFENDEGEKRGFFPVRMPYGLGMFSGLGKLAHDIQHEKSRLVEGEELATGHFWIEGFKLLSHNFAPISGAPTLAGKMFYNTVRNEDNIGRAVAPMKYDPDVSDFETAFPNTPEFLRDAAYNLANLDPRGVQPNGKVDKYGRLSYNEGAALDVSPETIDYVMGELFAGVYSEFKSTLQMFTENNKREAYEQILGKVYDGFDPNKWPLMKRVYQYKPTLDVRLNKINKIGQKSKDRLLSQYQLHAYYKSLEGMYTDRLIDLDEFNKRYDRIIKNQANLLGAPTSMRKQLKENFTETLNKPKMKIRGGVRRKKKREPIKKKRTDLPDAINTLKGALEERRSDD